MRAQSAKQLSARRSASPRPPSARGYGGTLSATPRGGGTPRAMVFAPGRPASILVHQKAAPPGPAGYGASPLKSGGRRGEEPPDAPFSLSVDYPAVGRRELFEIRRE